MSPRPLADVTPRTGAPADECPSDRTFAQLVEGTLDESRVGALQSHAARCAACGLTLTELARTVVPDRGDWLDERYRLLGPVGAGGMGIVYEAFDTKLRRKVAVKRLRDAGEGASVERRRARALREARLLASLSHPNVLTVHDIGGMEGELYVVMELIDGRPMSRWISEAPARLNWRQIVDLYLEAARGLAAAHRLDVVHRDIKPENILVARSGRVLIGDFGLAGLTETGETAAMAAGSPTSLTETGAVLGTPAYMAPEVHEGRPSDARSDQFSFCTSLYESLHGRRPFAGQTVAEIARAVRRGGLELGRDGVPDAIDRVIATGLSADPPHRYGSMEELSAALVRARDGRRVSSPRVVSVLALVAVASVFIFGLRRERSPARAPLASTETRTVPSPSVRAASGPSTGATVTTTAVAPPPHLPRPPATFVRRPGAGRIPATPGMPDGRAAARPVAFVPQGDDPTLLLLLADNAYSDRDGVACLTALNRMPSDAWPAALAARVARRHATCAMLSGGCEEGRRLLVPVDGRDGARRAMLANCPPDDLPTIEDRLLAVAEQADEARYAGNKAARREGLEKALRRQMASREIQLCLGDPTASRSCGPRLADLARAFQVVAEDFLAADACAEGAALDVMHSQVKMRGAGAGESNPALGCRATRTFETYGTCASEGHQAEQSCVARAQAARQPGEARHP